MIKDPSNGCIDIAAGIILVCLAVILCFSAIQDAESSTVDLEPAVHIPFVKRYYMTWGDIDPDCGPHGRWDPELYTCIPWPWQVQKVTE